MMLAQSLNTPVCGSSVRPTSSRNVVVNAPWLRTYGPPLQERRFARGRHIVAIIQLLGLDAPLFRTTLAPGSSATC